MFDEMPTNRLHFFFIAGKRYLTLKKRESKFVATGGGIGPSSVPPPFLRLSIRFGGVFLPGSFPGSALLVAVFLSASRKR